MAPVVPVGGASANFFCVLTFAISTDADICDREYLSVGNGLGKESHARRSACRLPAIASV